MVSTLDGRNCGETRCFIEADHEGGVLEEFTGKLLIQQEPDASSFRAVPSQYI
ncbi:MAG: glutamine synthetase III [Odoribacter splanchnicus]